jgi:uncharacterized protein (TIGR02231 family)
MDTHVTAVTVFPDRARVTRSGKTQLEVGVQKIEITELPLSLLPDSVRASGRGAARAKLLGVSTRLENYVDTPAERVRELEAQLQAAQDTDNELIARASVLEKEQKNLDGLAAQSEMFARGLALRNRTPAEQGAFFDFVTARSAGVQAELLKIGRDRRELGKEIERLRRELASVGAARPRQRYVAAVEVDVSAAGDFSLELTYVVNNAAWTPLYDLRLSEAGLDLTYLAQVSQRTGEEWPNVALTLSTAQPALSLTIPELGPWYVRPKPPPPPPMPQPARAKSMLAAAPMPAAAPAAAGMVQEPEAAYGLLAEADLAVESAAVSASGAALTYRLAGRADIPGNGDPRKVTIAVFPLKPALDYVTAPKLEAACYRRAKVKNTSEYSLLPGGAQLFEGDDYLGATHLEFTAPEQEFELFLGADERVRVERELVARDVDKTIIGDKRRIRYGYEITLENLRGAPQTILVRDQLPVARDEQIKVKLDLAEPKPAEHTDLNLLEWKLTLPPNAKQKVKFEFVVEYPRAMDVLGLP